ncbi:unnamed protein product [Polarella glacialis]|uniref:Sushi domain-containing protein n=1 Tax=Polarella glacialis TaxID=89957 RepID=A0A813D6Q2_POLGL|nr:unnamed protein product [Polarella glacialis]
MALQYYKFVTIDLRLEGYNVFQIADLEMSYSGKPLVFNLDVDTAYSIDGDAPDKELPQNILDMNLETKWLDYKKSPAIIRLAKKKPIHNYRLRTANDEAIRDPVLWNLQGSPDYLNWVIMHEVTNRTLGEALVPLNRSTWSTNFTIEIPCYAPTQAFIPNSPNITCQEGDILRSGSNCTTLCNDGFTPSIRTLLCKRAQLYPDSFYNCIAD